MMEGIRLFLINLNMISVYPLLPGRVPRQWAGRRGGGAVTINFQKRLNVGVVLIKTIVYIIHNVLYYSINIFIYFIIIGSPPKADQPLADSTLTLLHLMNLNILF